MASLYFDESLPPDAFVVAAEIAFGGDDARHAASVARVRTGEWIAIGDAAGRIARGPVLAVAPDRVVVRADEVVIEPVPAPAIWLAQALAKGDRDELAVQAATELGVAGVVPWAAARSVSRWDERKAQRGAQRWRAIVREAAKQSIRATVPQVGSLVTTAELAALPGATAAGLVLVLDPAGAEPISSVELGSADRVTLVVGPEGGIDPRELAAFEAAGARRVRLGPEVLRTSTAGPAALAALAIRLGRW